MPINHSRLQPSAIELTAAQAAYDASLRQRAAATVVAAARLRVDQARRRHDRVRHDQLLEFATGNALLGSIPGEQILSLFPVGVEAKFEPGRRLRIRVWPDVISTSTHDPRLTDAEANAGRRYWKADAEATTDDGHREAWRELADAAGITRGAWVARALTPINQSALAPGIEPLFPAVAMMDEAGPFVPRAGVLPDRWIVTGFLNDRKVFEHAGEPIPHDLAVGLDTTPSEAAALSNREGEPIQLPPRMRWLTDFEIAKQNGMAMEITLTDVDHLDLLLVYGVRVTQSYAESADAMAELMTGHRFSRGLAFVAQDTPTNNSADDESGMPSRDDRMDAAFELERLPRLFSLDLAANGTTAARAFGLDPQTFAPLAASGAATQLMSEPDGFEPEIARAMQTMLWQVTLGSMVEDFLGLDLGRAAALRDYFREHVRAAGPVPAIRVGRQPYGVLPVTTLNGFVAAPADGIDAGLIPLLFAAHRWSRRIEPDELYAGTPEEALRYLGRSTRLFAETTTQTGNGQNRWANLADTLVRLDAFPNTWRTEAIRKTQDAQPRREPRPTVDAATAQDLRSIATAAPAALLSSALPSSILARMARQAALLEWGRFSRAVCDVALDALSKRSLIARARANGIDAYLTVIIDAVNATANSAGSVPTPAIDREEQRRIFTLVGNNLARPRANAPGGGRLTSFRRALTTLSQFTAPLLESAMYRALDVCNHRVDAWATSLATRRLASLRVAAPRGIVIGGWGCLQDVRPADPGESAEFIHTPSLDHAAAAAVLRSGARRAFAAQSSHADVDLSSRRVRLARWILEGLRNGRSLSEMLGMRVERALKGTAGGVAHLGTLRRKYPSRSRNGVIDGLELIASPLPATSDPAVIAAATAGMKAAEETMDALADVLTAESVFQLVKGNTAGALLDLEDIARGRMPPPLGITETPPSGTRLTHRIAIAIPRGAKAPGWPENLTPRAQADPLLEAWCGFLLGPPTRTVFTVEAGDSTMAVPLAALGIAAIDVMCAARDGGSELAERVVLAARRASTGFDVAVRHDHAWKDLVGMCEVMLRTVTLAQPLRADAFEAPDALVTRSAEDVGDLPARAMEATDRLIAVRAQLTTGNPAEAVRGTAAFGVRIPGLLLATLPAPPDLDALRSAVDARLAAAAIASTPRERLHALFAGDVHGLVATMPRAPASLTTTTSPPPASLLDGDLLAPLAWLDAMGRTRPAVARLAEILQRIDIAGGASPSQLRVAQTPWVDGDRWIATSFGDQQPRPGGRLSVIIHAPAGFDPTEAVGGLLVDAWVESVPFGERDTAMALRYNSPNTRPPQTILLAVNPDPSQAWTAATLETILRETLESARTRMLPPASVSRSGHLPLVLLGQRESGAGSSFEI
jgi:hypothetical protein